MTDWSELSGRPEVQALAGVFFLGLVANTIFAVGAWRRVRVPAAAWLLAPALCLGLASVGPLVALRGGASIWDGVVAPGHLAAEALLLARAQEVLAVLAAVCLLFTTSIVAPVGHVLGAGESSRWAPRAALPVLGLGLGGTMAVAAVGAALEVGTFGGFTALVVLGASLGLSLLSAREAPEEHARERLAGARALVGVTGVVAASSSGWLLLAVAHLIEARARVAEPGVEVAHRLAVASEQLAWAGGLTVVVAVFVLGAAALVAVFPVVIPLSSPRSLTSGFVLALLATVPLAARIPWWESEPRVSELAVVGGGWNVLALRSLPHVRGGRIPAPGMMAGRAGEAWRGGLWRAGEPLPVLGSTPLVLPVSGGELTVVVGASLPARVVSGEQWARERVVLRMLGRHGADGHARALDLTTSAVSWWPELPDSTPLVARDRGDIVLFGPPGEERAIVGPLAPLLRDAKHGVVLVPGPTWTIQDVVDMCELAPGPCGLLGRAEVLESAAP